MKTLFKLIGTLLLVILLLAALLIGTLTVTEYRPADREALLPSGKALSALPAGDTLTAVAWNVGYGALGSNADFFMDGGSGVVTADRDRVSANLAGISAELKRLDPDLILLQEVDRSSDRSHRVDETVTLSAALPGRSAVFANNFNVLFVPYPIPPIGHVDSGLYTLSRAQIAAAERVALPCPFSWPIRTANLKRCLLVSRIPVEGTDKQLVAVNLHLEAYDDGSGKAAQTEMLARFLQAEADRGNYVIAGGDFNQVFSNVDTAAWPVYEGKWQPGAVEAGAFGEGFRLMMDPRTATCRSLDRPLDGADLSSFQFYMIDGFIVSANVETVSLETLDMGFEHTDHNPVRLEFRLK